MTTPPDADDVPETPEPAPAQGWAPPDAPLTDLPPAAPAAVPPAVPYGSGPTRRRTNRFAIAALVTGLLGLAVIAIGFAITALVQTGRRGEKGKGLAIGALAASTAWIIALTTVAATFAAQGSHGGAATAGGNGKPRVSTLQVGDCFDEFEEDLNSIYVNVTSCIGPHEGEIGAAIPMPIRPYPGDTALLAEATKQCRDHTQYLMANRYSAHLELHIDRPRRKEWEHGDRLVTCVLRYTGKEELSATLGSEHWGPKAYGALAPGDCIKKWRFNATISVVACTEKHEEEVYAAFDLSGGDSYPPLRALEAKVARGCAEQAHEVFGSDPPKHVLPDVSFPSEESWGYGDRLVICMFKGAGGPLRHSVMPG
ncbi:septum formation family protein [Actinomadura sp. NTSP31]|uniref:DUF4190 domain-containing protein n=1 Tax=Actinomadura sp. NTSP31 TaxID=1735447 RepID=UPI0035C0BD26